MSTMIEQKTLNVNTEFFKNLGIENVKVDLILREGSQSVVTFETEGKVHFPKEFYNFIPFGNPPKFMAGYGYEDEQGYISIFHTNDTAIHLIGTTDRTKLRKHPIALLGPVKRAMDKTLQESSGNIHEFNMEMSEDKLELKLNLIRSLKNFDTILYSLLTRRKVVIVGETKQGIQLLESILLLIPKGHENSFGFSINLPYHDHPSIILHILDPKIDTDVEGKMSKYIDAGVDLIDLEKNTCFGEFTCDYTKRLMDIINQGDDLTRAYQLTEEIVQLVNNLNKDESAIEFANRKSIRFDNADLITAMRDLDLREN